MKQKHALPRPSQETPVPHWAKPTLQLPPDAHLHSGTQTGLEQHVDCDRAQKDAGPHSVP